MWLCTNESSNSSRRRDPSDRRLPASGAPALLATKATDVRAVLSRRPRLLRPMADWSAYVSADNRSGCGERLGRRNMRAQASDICHHVGGV